ncbi:MAG TPA: glutaredoxin family protein [Clostridia bacterium]|nr:glutaredoxin family protein [Clostridia bacterium]
MEVKVYTSNTCSYCHMVKEYLEEKGVEYVERNVSTDSEARKELIANGFMGVPVVYIGDEVIQGFDKKKLDELL